MVAGLPDEVAILRSPTDAVTKLGSDEATSVLTPEFLSLVPGFFAADVVARRLCMVSRNSPAQS